MIEKFVVLKFSYNLVVVKAIRSLLIVPVAILFALIFVILAPSPAKLVTLIAAGNLALAIVPVNLVAASRLGISSWQLLKQGFVLLLILLMMHQNH